MCFTKKDEECMNLALEQARLSYKTGNLPIGAVLVMDGEILGVGRNNSRDTKDFVSHAENKVVQENSKKIRENYKDKKNIVLYTTLEPCLMCLGTALMNRISKIIYSIDDPSGGSTSLDRKSLPEWYSKKWPLIKSGLKAKESLELFNKFMSEENEFWRNMQKPMNEVNKKYL